MTKWTRINEDGIIQTFDDREDGVWDTMMWWWNAPKKTIAKTKRKKNHPKKTINKDWVIFILLCLSFWPIGMIIGIIFINVKKPWCKK